MNKSGFGKFFSSKTLLTNIKNFNPKITASQNTREFFVKLISYYFALKIQTPLFTAHSRDC